MWLGEGGAKLTHGDRDWGRVEQIGTLSSGEDSFKYMHPSHHIYGPESVIKSP